MRPSMSVSGTGVLRFWLFFFLHLYRRWHHLVICGCLWSVLNISILGLGRLSWKLAVNGAGVWWFGDCKRLGIATTFSAPFLKVVCFLCPGRQELGCLSTDRALLQLTTCLVPADRKPTLSLQNIILAWCLSPLPCSEHLCIYSTFYIFSDNKTRRRCLPKLTCSVTGMFTGNSDVIFRLGLFQIHQIHPIWFAAPPRPLLRIVSLGLIYHLYHKCLHHSSPGHIRCALVWQVPSKPA